MKKVLAVLTLALFLGGISATAIAASTQTINVEITADEEKKTEKKAENLPL